MQRGPLPECSAQRARVCERRELGSADSGSTSTLLAVLYVSHLYINFYRYLRAAARIRESAWKKTVPVCACRASEPGFARGEAASCEPPIGNGDVHIKGAGYLILQMRTQYQIKQTVPSIYDFYVD